ncbi:MAG: YncE family protein, partial [Gaiellaceae bacterium]
MNRRQFVFAAAALPVLLRRDPLALASRLGGGRQLALVTADSEAHVVALRLRDGAVVARLRTLAGPRSIQTVGNDAVVAHTSAGAVTVIDGESLRVRHVLRGFEEPRYTAGSPYGPLAYVTDSAAGEVVVVDILRGRIVWRAEVDGPARHVSLSPSERTLWVSLGSSATRIAVLSLQEPHRPRLARFVTPPFPAHDVGYEPSGHRLWLTSGDVRHETVLVCDGSGRVLRRLPGGATPQHVTFVGHLAHVSSGADGTLRVYSLLDGRLRRTTRLPLGSYNVQAADGLVLTPS